MERKDKKVLLEIIKKWIDDNAEELIEYSVHRRDSLVPVIGWQFRKELNETNLINNMEQIFKYTDEKITKEYYRRLDAKHNRGK